MRNDTGRNKPDRPSGSSPETGTAGRKTPRETSPQYTDAQKETMQAGLRILARIITRAHLRHQEERGSEPSPGPPTAGESLE